MKFLKRYYESKMTIDNIERYPNKNSFVDSVSLTFICPKCKKKKILEIPKSFLSKNEGLSTVSIEKGLVCDHIFQAFIDKNYKIRGYQKVDFELNSRTKDPIYKEKKTKGKDRELFSNLIKEENYIEYPPKNQRKGFRETIHLKRKSLTNAKNTNKSLNKSLAKIKQKSLEQIYEDFWEFIDENNESFQEFILKDKRRKIKLIS